MLQTNEINGRSENARKARVPAADKVRRYQWKMEHRPGQCTQVQKGQIDIDRRYQRELNDKKRLEIASAFNWVAFGALSLNRRADGSLWCLDGQHRLVAARSRNDIDTVPCVIFQIPDSIEEEAAAFLALNTLRKSLTSREKFKGQLASNDEIALTAAELINQVGRSLESSANGQGIDCLTALMSLIRNDVNSARLVWPLIAEICEGQRIDNRLVAGVGYLERRLIDANGERRSLIEPDNKRKLVEAGATKILQSIGAASAYHHRGGEVVFAKGILNIVNYRRQHRLRIKGQEDLDGE